MDIYSPAPPKSVAEDLCMSHPLSSSIKVCSYEPPSEDTALTGHTTHSSCAVHEPAREMQDTYIHALFCLMTLQVNQQHARTVCTRDCCGGDEHVECRMSSKKSVITYVHVRVTSRAPRRVDEDAQGLLLAVPSKHDG